MEVPMDFRLLYGSIIVFCSIVFIAFYIPVLMVLSKKEFRNLTAYRIILTIGLLDCTELVVHGFCGIMIILNLEIPHVMNKIIGAVMLSTFITIIILYMFLSLNRLLFIVFPNYAPTIWTATVTWVLLSLAALKLFAVLILKLQPMNSYLFIPEIANWITPETDSDFSHHIWAYANYIMPIYVVVASISYVIIFSYVKISRRTHLSKQEKLATIMTFGSLIAMLLAFVFWTFILPYLKSSSILANFLSLMFWLLLNGANPFVYLTVNRQGFYLIWVIESGQFGDGGTFCTFAACHRRGDLSREPFL